MSKTEDDVVGVSIKVRKFPNAPRKLVIKYYSAIHADDHVVRPPHKVTMSLSELASNLSL